MQEVLLQGTLVFSDQVKTLNKASVKFKKYSFGGFIVFVIIFIGLVTSEYKMSLVYLRTTELINIWTCVKSLKVTSSKYTELRFKYFHFLFDLLT